MKKAITAIASVLYAMTASAGPIEVDTEKFFAYHRLQSSGLVFLLSREECPVAGFDGYAQVHTPHFTTPWPACWGSKISKKIAVCPIDKDGIAGLCYFFPRDIFISTNSLPKKAF